MSVSVAHARPRAVEDPLVDTSGAVRKDGRGSEKGEVGSEKEEVGSGKENRTAGHSGKGGLGADEVGGTGDQGGLHGAWSVYQAMLSVFGFQVPLQVLMSMQAGMQKAIVTSCLHWREVMERCLKGKGVDWSERMGVPQVLWTYQSFGPEQLQLARTSARAFRDKYPHATETFNPFPPGTSLQQAWQQAFLEFSHPATHTSQSIPPDQHTVNQLAEKLGVTPAVDPGGRSRVERGVPIDVEPLAGLQQQLDEAERVMLSSTFEQAGLEDQILALRAQVKSLKKCYDQAGKRGRDAARQAQQTRTAIDRLNQSAQQAQAASLDVDPSPDDASPTRTSCLVPDPTRLLSRSFEIQGDETVFHDPDRMPYRIDADGQDRQCQPECYMTGYVDASISSSHAADHFPSVLGVVGDGISEPAVEHCAARDDEDRPISSTHQQHDQFPRPLAWDGSRRDRVSPMSTGVRGAWSSHSPFDESDRIPGSGQDCCRCARLTPVPESR